MSLSRYTPQAVSEQGIKAVHQRPFCANEDSQIVGRFDAETAWAAFLLANSVVILKVITISGCWGVHS